ncbi:hypothetical protein HGRIS_006602 [Hohenbuehelia grisea]|uniref:Embryonic stem cell-specific 5-hydroxymethylcytosine-binding protein n=1 Tax=Hohenbuehelia grisea TaxID=104357 RepID=A0ABR3J9H8_9AGAR
MSRVVFTLFLYIFVDIGMHRYYEWLTKGKEKLPHFVKHKSSQVMLMAGLYDCATPEGETEPLWTFTIVTTAANHEFRWLHDRQPVILSTKEAFDAWLDTSSQSWTPELTRITEPFHDSASPLECYQVPKEVGKVGTESPSFIEPIATRKDGIQAMFTKQTQAKAQPEDSLGLKATPTKRKRSPSPTIALDNSQSSSTPRKRRDTDDEKALLKTPSKPSASGSQPSSPAKSKVVKSPSSPRKKKAKTDESSSKITSFFGKA